MSFLSPLLLLGLFGALIPPIIHLLLRRKPKRVRFSSLEFILRSHRKTARNFRLRQIALMLVRCLFVFFLVTALARPIFTSEADQAGISSIDGGNVILVLDGSYPMGYMLDGESLLTHAKIMAGNVIDQPNIRVGVVLAEFKPRAPFSGLTGDISAVQKELAKLEVGQYGRRLESATSLAYSLAADRKGSTSTSVIVLSTPAGLETLPPVPKALKGVQLIRLDVSKGRALPNRSILEVLVKPAPQMGSGHWEIGVRVGNFGEQDATAIPIHLELDDRNIVNGFLDIPKQAEATKTFYVALERERTGKANVIIKGDNLAIDDSYPFWLSPAPSIRLLAVNGSPNSTPYRDELYYLTKAIEPALTSGARIDLVKTIRSDLSKHSLDKYDVIVLANIESLSAKDARRITGFVKAGGGLFVTMGSQTDPVALNSKLGPLLARTIRSKRIAGDAAASSEGRDRNVAYFKRFDREHPILAKIPQPQTTSLALVKVEKYMLLDPSPTAGGHVVISLDDGSPILLSKDVGAGRVVQFASTIDREWNDLPIRPHFLPMIVHILRFLAKSRSVESRPVFVGKPAAIQIEDPTVSQLQVKTPTGEIYSIARPKSALEKWLFASTLRVGHYAIEGTKNTALSEPGFSVRVNPDYGRLRSLQVPKKAGDLKNTATTSKISERQELWHLALGLLFVLLSGEALLLFRRRRGRSVESPSVMAKKQSRA